MNKLKRFFADNYNILSLYLFIALFYTVFSGNDLGLYYNESSFSLYLFIWALFIYMIWSLIKQYKKDNKSIWILIYGLFALIYNPMKTNIHYSYSIITLETIIMIATMVIIIRKLIFNKKILSFIFNKKTYSNFFKK